VLACAEPIHVWPAASIAASAHTLACFDIVACMHAAYENNGDRHNLKCARLLVHSRAHTHTLSHHLVGVVATCMFSCHSGLIPDLVEVALSSKDPLARNMAAVILRQQVSQSYACLRTACVRLRAVWCERVGERASRCRQDLVNQALSISSCMYGTCRHEQFVETRTCGQSAWVRCHSSQNISRGWLN
jgi:hypothetical protein